VSCRRFKKVATTTTATTMNKKKTELWDAETN